MKKYFKYFLYGLIYLILILVFAVMFIVTTKADVIYKRYFAVPFVSAEKRKTFLEDVKNTALNL